MSYVSLLYHIVLRTKRSVPAISESHERELYLYILMFVRSRDCVLHRIGGMPDHIHLLVSARPTICLSDFMRDLKTATSKFLKANRNTMFPLFDGWESEYYASTVSKENKDSVKQYIMNQKEHHKVTSFRDEFLRLCKENGIEVDERYLPE